MPFTTLFFDLDDTLYPPSTGVWDAIGDRIDLYIQTRVGCAPGRGFRSARTSLPHLRHHPARVDPHPRD